MLIRVPQYDATGCAVAAIATIVGKPYQSVMRRAFGPRWHKVDDPGMCETHMIKVIRGYGYKVRKARNFSFNDNAILFVDVGAYWKTTIWHCLVWDPDCGGRLLDPAWNQKPDLGYYIGLWVKSGKQTLITRKP